jgi:hypothetical protein
VKPPPNLGDSAAMARLGRLSALRSHRADTLHALRDCASKLLSGQHDDAALIAEARWLLDRLEEVAQIERREYGA